VAQKYFMTRLCLKIINLKSSCVHSEVSSKDWIFKVPQAINIHLSMWRSFNLSHTCDTIFKQPTIVKTEEGKATQGTYVWKQKLLIP